MVRDLPHLPMMAELWSKRTEPASRTPRRALRLAESLGADPEATAAELALAWTIVHDVYTTLEWEIPASPHLARCRSAAVSVALNAGLVVDEALQNLEGLEGDVMLLGDLGFALSLFGRPDVFPARGAILVSLGEPGGEPLSAAAIPAASGVRWADGGRLREVFAETAIPGTLGNRSVLLPAPGLVAALTATTATGDDPLACILFCFAAHRTGFEGHWDLAGTTARKLGTLDRLATAARHHGFESHPSLGNPLLLRLRTAARNLIPTGKRT